jgi:hypothetical protein
MDHSFWATLKNTYKYFFGWMVKIFFWATFEENLNLYYLSNLFLYKNEKFWKVDILTSFYKET